MARFTKGAPSPNPNGRPRGSKSAMRLAESGLVSDDDLKEIVLMLMDKAKEGDLAAAAMILDRTIAKVKPIVDDVDRESSLAQQLQAARLRALAESGLPLKGTTFLVDPTRHASPQVASEPRPPAPLLLVSPPSSGIPTRAREDRISTTQRPASIRIDMDADPSQESTQYNPL